MMSGLCTGSEAKAGGTEREKGSSVSQAARAEEFVCRESFCDGAALPHEVQRRAEGAGGSYGAQLLSERQ